MSELLRELELSCDKALKSQSVQEGIHHLSRAFTLFSEETARLKAAYGKLEERFEAVNLELGKKVEELQRTGLFLNNILKNISDAILFIDLNGTILMINDAGQKLLEVKAEEILFKPFMKFFEDGHFGFSMKEALKFGISHKLLYKTLETKEVEVSTSFIYSGPKPYHGMILLLRDISEKQHLQMVASRNDRMKELGVMAAIIAHEIRNPLGGIRGYASLLYRDLESDPNLQEMAGSIIEGTKTLEKLVSTVLHYARPIQMQLESKDLVLFLKELGKFIKADPAFPPNIRLIMHTPDEPLIAPIDSGALKSAFLNLLFNAIQAMPKGGIITLTLFRKDEKNCQITLSDTGVGIEEERLEKLFSPFFTTKEKGTGLGLVETEKIIHAHFGSIAVRSKIDKGTTFTLTLPLYRS